MFQCLSQQWRTISLWNQTSPFYGHKQEKLVNNLHLGLALLLDRSPHRDGCLSGSKPIQQIVLGFSGFRVSGCYGSGWLLQWRTSPLPKLKHNGGDGPWIPVFTGDSVCILGVFAIWIQKSALARSIQFLGPNSTVDPHHPTRYDEVPPAWSCSVTFLASCSFWGWGGCWVKLHNIYTEVKANIELQFISLNPFSDPAYPILGSFFTEFKFIQAASKLATANLTPLGSHWHASFMTQRSNQWNTLFHILNMNEHDCFILLSCIQDGSTQPPHRRFYEPLAPLYTSQHPRDDLLHCCCFQQASRWAPQGLARCDRGDRRYLPLLEDANP